MKHIVFRFALLCFIVSVASKNIADPHAISSQNNISFDVNKFIIIPRIHISTSPMSETKCECAVFDTQHPAEDGVPIVSHGPFTVGCNCNSSGEENCRKLCAALAEAAGDHGPQLLCSTLGHYNNLTASVHSRIYGGKQWTYTDVTVPNKICCHEHQVIACKDQMENQALNQI